jgi:hypothetical protein
MQVPIIENWSDVSGTVLSMEPSPDIQGFVAVELAVERVDPVEGYANLLAHVAGAQLVVHVPEEVAQNLGLGPGDAVQCRVRRAGLDRAFVHREHISIR